MRRSWTVVEILTIVISVSLTGCRHAPSPIPIHRVQKPLTSTQLEAAARSFLNLIGEPAASTARLTSTEKKGEFDYRFVYKGVATVDMNARDGNMISYWNESEFLSAPRSPQQLRKPAFKSESQAIRFIEATAYILGLPPDASVVRSTPFYEDKSGRGFSRSYAWKIRGLPVFGGGPTLHISVDMYSGKVTYVEARKDYVIDESVRRLAAADAEAIVKREEAKLYGPTQSTIFGPSEFGYVMISGHWHPPFHVRLGWRVPIANSIAFEAAVDAETGKVIGWIDALDRFPDK